MYALLAQLDRAFGYGPKGQEFESLTARHKRKDLPNRVGLFLLFHINRDENSVEFAEAVQNARKRFGTVKSGVRQNFR